jgi:glycosyltransferase involved in cell wall biosynthesis
MPAPKPNAPLRLGAFGRFHRQKGFDLLIEAMRQISPSEAQLHIAGYGEDEDSLRGAAADLPHVTIGGRVDPAAFLSQLDVVVMPSRWEAGAVTCWEVRASGRSMIVSDGLPEQVPPDIGIVVPPNDPDSIASTIRQLAGTDRRDMAIQARASTAGAFERSLTAWATLLEEPKAATRWQTRWRLKAFARAGSMGQSA